MYCWSLFSRRTIRDSRHSTNTAELPLGAVGIPAPARAHESKSIAAAKSIADPSMNPLLTILTRAGRVESVHHGRLAVATSDGPLFTAGLADEPAFPRSALKPFQALPLLEDDLDRALGLDLREVTLTCASHGGDERHVEVAASLLKKGGVEASSLLCGKHAPMDDAAARRLFAAGLEPT